MPISGPPLDPPPLFEGNVHQADDLPHVPRTLSEATSLFERSEFTRATLGSDVVDHYARFFRTEQAAYDRAVTS